MPNNKRHTLKTIKKKDQLHPSSRKARQLTRVYMRQERLLQSKQKSVNPKVERYLWFRDALDESLPCASIEKMHELVDLYLNRHNKQKLDRPHRNKVVSTKESLLKHYIEGEREEYENAGLEMPDLRSDANVKYLRAWSGDYSSLVNVESFRLRAANKPTETNMTEADQSNNKESALDSKLDAGMDTS